MPNSTVCADDEIARVGFMRPDDVESYVQGLETCGLVCLTDGKATDLAIVDQQRGPMMPCDWLEFGRLPFGEQDERISACWFFEGARRGAGLHMRGTSMELAIPFGWEFEGSLSQRFIFVPSGSEDDRLTFLREDGGVLVFRDEETGKEV